MNDAYEQTKRILIEQAGNRVYSPGDSYASMWGKIVENEGLKLDALSRVSLMTTWKAWLNHLGGSASALESPNRVLGKILTALGGTPSVMEIEGSLIRKIREAMGAEPLRPETLAHIARVTADGGVVEDVPLLDRRIKTLVDAGLWDDTVLLIGAGMGEKRRVSGADSYLSRAYDAALEGDFSQTVESQQPLAFPNHWGFDGVDDSLNYAGSAPEDFLQKGRMLTYIFEGNIPERGFHQAIWIKTYSTVTTGGGLELYRFAGINQWRSISRQGGVNFGYATGIFDDIFTGGKQQICTELDYTDSQPVITVRSDGGPPESQMPSPTGVFDDSEATIIRIGFRTVGNYFQGKYKSLIIVNGFVPTEVLNALAS